MTEPSHDDGDDETSGDEADSGAEDEVEEFPPGARENDGEYRDKYDEARESANPDQHRDEEPHG